MCIGFDFTNCSILDHVHASCFAIIVVAAVAAAAADGGAAAIVVAIFISN